MKEPKLYSFFKPFISIFIKMFRPNIYGIENIPKEGKYILAGNHTSYLDCLLLIATSKRYIHFLAKDSLLHGFKKILFKNMGIIPVNRKIHDSRCLEMAQEVLGSGGVIGIFPEGTINKTNEYTMKFKKGASKLSYTENCHIVPFVICGKYHIFKNSLNLVFLPKYRVLSEDFDAESENLREIINSELKRRMAWTF